MSRYVARRVRNGIVNNMEEKKAIAFTSYKRSDGFEISLTFRGDTGTEVLTLLDKAISAIVEKGGTPLSKNASKYPTKPSGGMCKVHEVEMKLNKNGNPYHSKGVYPDLSFCNGKGFVEKSDVKKEVDDSFNSY